MKKPLIQNLLQFLARFSPATLHRFARISAFFVGRFPNQINHYTRKNLSLCFPKLNSSDFDNIYRQAIFHSCMSFLELAHLWCRPLDSLLQAATEVKTPEDFEHPARGRLIIAPHLGSWEFLNLWLANQNELLSLYKPQKDPATDDFILQSRSRNGAQLVATGTSGLRQVIKGLKQNKTIMILPDQKPRRYKSHVDSLFFGQRARTSGLVQSLCDRVECDVYIACATRQIDALSYKISIEKLDYSQLAETPQISADYLNQSIEKLVAFSPEQYQWGYPRFSKSAYRTTEGRSSVKGSK